MSSLFADLEIIVAQSGPREEQIRISHHQPARQYADGTFEDAHMDVHFEAVYILASEEGLREGDHGGVVAA